MKTQEHAGEEDICRLTKVQYTDTPVHIDHETLLQTARWLQDAVEREARDADAEINNPLEGLLRDERRQSIAPEGRERLLDLMDRMGDGKENAPEGADEALVQTMREAVRSLHVQMTADHAERPGDDLLYELN